MIIFKATNSQFFQSFSSLVFSVSVTRKLLKLNKYFFREYHKIKGNAGFSVAVGKYIYLYFFFTASAHTIFLGFLVALFFK